MARERSEGKKSRITTGVPIDPADADTPRGLRRFGRQLGAFQAALDRTAKPPHPAELGAYQQRPHLEEATFGHTLYADNGRTPLFMVQALARIERSVRKHHEVFDQVRYHAKVLEDGLGEVDFWWVFLTKGEQWRLPAPVLSWAETQHAHACGTVEGWLEANDWVEHRYLPEKGKVALRAHRLGVALREARWPGPKKARRRLVEFLVDDLRTVQAQALKLDLDDLEGGLHALRRKVRWFSIYGAALEGAICLDPTAAPPAGWERYLVKEIVESKFAGLPAADPELEPIVLPAPLFHALSWIIAELGKLKDRAQWSEAIESGLRVTRGTGDASRWLGEQALSHREAGKLAGKVLQQAIVHDEVLLRLAAAIEEQG